MPQPLIPLDWDSELVELLAEIAPQDAEGAKVWWEMYAPRLYAYLLEAWPVGDSMGLRDEVDIRGYLESQSMSNTQRILLAAGLLFIFAGGRYYTIKGIIVPRSGVVTATNKALLVNMPAMQELCDKLRTGAISLRVWQTAMRNHIVQSNVAAGMAAAGGHMALTPQHIWQIQQRIHFQLVKLAAFALRIAAGMKLDGTVCRLMKMYLNSARGTYHLIDGMIVLAAGFTEYRNVLGAGEEHCTGGGSCPEVSDKGWQPVGTLTPIGARKCMSNCLCTWQYRNPFTGQVW